MNPTSLSATSVKAFLACESRWAAIYGGKRRNYSSSDAAELGTACHTALERVFSKSSGFWSLSALEMAFVDAIEETTSFGTVPKWVDEGLVILKTWWDRQDWADWSSREILSIEERAEFELETSIGPIPFVYVIDRLDRLEDGELEVVDYKSGFFQLRGDDLVNDIQARSYALAAWLKHGRPKRVWVLFDYLRNDIPSTSVAFTAADCEAHLELLHDIAEQIIASDGQEETPSGTCRFCPRALECASLYQLGLTDLHGLDLEQLAILKLEVMGAVNALEANKRRIDSSLREALDNSDDSEIWLPSGHLINLTLGRRDRIVDWKQVAKILSIPAVPARVSPVAFTEYLDEAEINNTYSADIIKELRDCIVEERGTPQVRVVKPAKIG